MNLSLGEIAGACGGRFLQGAERAGRTVSAVCADSRSPASGCLFIPLTGPNFDGHAYIAEMAVSGHAVGALTERAGIPDIPADFPLIQVASARRALLDLAAHYRRKLNVTVVAVTGSAGKTTTKDLTAHVLAGRFRVRKTPGNLNNAVGMPLTVLGADEADEVLVLEMGMNHAGEIAALSKAARPDWALVTNIGDAHIGQFGSREDILRAKMEIRTGMDGGVLVLNRDDGLLCAAGGYAEGLRVVWVGTSDGGADLFGPCPTRNPVSAKPEPNGVYASDISPDGFKGVAYTLRAGDARAEVFVPLPGRFSVANSLMAAAVGLSMGLTVEEVRERLAGFVPSSANRLDLINAGGVVLVNDTYNANPAAVCAAMDLLVQGAPDGRRVCVLGDMLELGAQGPALHRQVGWHAARAGVDALIAVGDLARHIYEGYTETDGAGAAFWFETKGACLDWLRRGTDAVKLIPGDAVLVKASRSMRFEDIVTEMRAMLG